MLIEVPLFQLSFVLALENAAIRSILLKMISNPVDLSLSILRRLQSTQKSEFVPLSKDTPLLSNCFLESLLSPRSIQMQLRRSTAYRLSSLEKLGQRSVSLLVPVQPSHLRQLNQPNQSRIRARRKILDELIEQLIVEYKKGDYRKEDPFEIVVSAAL